MSEFHDLIDKIINNSKIQNVKYVLAKYFYLIYSVIKIIQLTFIYNNFIINQKYSILKKSLTIKFIFQ